MYIVKLWLLWIVNENNDKKPYKTRTQYDCVSMCAHIHEDSLEEGLPYI